MKRSIPRSTVCASGAFSALVVLVATGCQPTQLGQCDESEAKVLVFDINGNPAYAGQAMVEQACSSCHSQAATAALRRGAPAELDFDMQGSRNGDLDAPETSALDRLSDARNIIFDWRFEMFDTVENGSMPPGEIGLAAFQDAQYHYADGRPLERMESTQGQEVYRAWLACNGPVVAATATPTDASMAGQSCSAGEEVTSIGDCVYRQGGRTIDPTWTAIFEEILGPTGSGTCVPSCHTDGAAFADQSQLVLDDKDAAYAALVGQPAMGTADDGTMCADVAPNRVTPGEPDNSFLVQKLELDADALCGNPMPIGRRLSADTEIAAIRAWIQMGAMDN